MLFVPLISNGVPIGVFSITRATTGSFAEHHVQLLLTFADQAVIAIENVRLFNETREAWRLGIVGGPAGTPTKADMMPVDGDNCFDRHLQPAISRAVRPSADPRDNVRYPSDTC